MQDKFDSFCHPKKGKNGIDEDLFFFLPFLLSLGENAIPRSQRYRALANNQEESLSGDNCCG